MLSFLSIVHLIVAAFLIVLVLLQDSKGGSVGGAFGGGLGNANSILGATGAVSFMVKLTRYTVIVFAITCILLTRFASERAGSALDNADATTQSVTPLQPPKGVPAAETKTGTSSNPASPQSPTEKK